MQTKRCLIRPSTSWPIYRAAEQDLHICIIGITRNAASDRFCITWAERSYVSYDTKVLYGLEKRTEAAISTRKEDLPPTMKRDEDAVKTSTEYAHATLMRDSPPDILALDERSLFKESSDDLKSDEQQERVNTDGVNVESLAHSTNEKSGPRLISLNTNDLASRKIEGFTYIKRKRRHTSL